MSSSGVLYVCAVVCLFPAILLAQKKSSMSRHQLELKEHYEHLAKIAEFECDLPQPRLLFVDELLSDFQIRGKAYFPEVTVLHRCDRHVGSCNDGTHQCGPIHATTVSMPFKVTFLEEMGGHAKGEWEMEYHKLENHTACGCLKYDVVKKPTKTAVHYHYVDPSLMQPGQNPAFLPLDPTSQAVPGNASSYDIPVYQSNNTQQSSGNETYQEETPYQIDNNFARPSIDEMTKLAEEEVGPVNEEETKPDVNPGEEVAPVPYEEETKPDEEVKCIPCSEAQSFPGYPGNPSSESPIENEVRIASSSPRVPSVDEENDADSTTIDSELIRFGAVDSPRFSALTDVESPYDSYLKKALS